MKKVESVRGMTSGAGGVGEGQTSKMKEENVR